MSRANRRKKNRSRAAAARVEGQEKVVNPPAGAARRVPGRPRASLQNVIFSLMVALGLLGLAIFFTFFYSEDANHYLYSAIAALTALGWLVISVRRLSAYRQSVN